MAYLRTREEYEDANETICQITGRAHIPPARNLLRGGIIGSVEVIDVVSESESPWFFGPRGLVLRDPFACDLVPCVGALGYFKWSPADASIVPAPARWMLPPSEVAAATDKPLIGDLFG